MKVYPSNFKPSTWQRVDVTPPPRLVPLKVVYTGLGGRRFQAIARAVADGSWLWDEEGTDGDDTRMEYWKSLDNSILYNPPLRTSEPKWFSVVESPPEREDVEIIYTDADEIDRHSFGNIRFVEGEEEDEGGMRWVWGDTCADPGQEIDYEVRYWRHQESLP